MKRFEGRTALVTGASRGLGKSCALAFGREGAHVVVGYLSRREDAEDTVVSIKRAGGSGRAVAMDIRDKKAIAEAVRSTVAEVGGIDILVNNAGVVRDQLFGMLVKEEWDHVLEVNLTGTMQCCKAVLPYMMSKGSGSIVNLASVAALKASIGQISYAAAKGGVLAFTKTLAAECGPRGIRVNAVVPGMIDEGMTTRVNRKMIDQRLSGVPLGRLGRADEVDHAILFLAGDESAYMTGQMVIVDGGLSL